MNETNLPIQINVERGKKLAKFLCNIYFIKCLFRKYEVPEDTNLIEAKIGFLDQILYLTLTVSIDYQRDAPLLWVGAFIGIEKYG